MSKPGIIYRITHQAWDVDFTDVQEVVDISDNDNLIDDADDEQIIDLIPSGDCVTCSVIDNSEDPFTVIKSQQLVIKINTDNPVTLDTFASGSDSRWSVHNYIGAKTLFKGFLVLDDMSEAFMPEPNILTLTATDGLGLLKEIPLVDFDGENPVGEYTVGEIIAMCLNQTGTPLQINVAFNIKPYPYDTDISVPNTSAQHFFSLIYLNAKTFEDKVGSCIDCYKVLQYILGEEAHIFQRQGAWWIVRLDEKENATRDLYITTFTSAGVFIGNLGGKSFDKSIGKDSPYKILFAKEQTSVIPTRPVKSVELTYNYDFPLEIVDNIDFERGDLISVVSATESTYEVDDWAFGIHQRNGGASTAPNGNAVITRIFSSLNYETERYITIDEGVGVHDPASLRSNGIPVGARDKIGVSISFRFNVDFGDLLTQSLAVELVGDDGTYWYMLETGFWFQYPLGAGPILFLNNTVGSGQDNTEWYTTTVDTSNEIPVAGTLYLYLFQNAPGASTEVYYQDLRFEYFPHINGSHKKYTAVSQKVTQPAATINDYKAKREANVYCSDAPRKLIKGAWMLPLLYVDLFTGSVQFFVTINTFQISGYHLGKFRKGQRIQISTTTSNNVATRVKSVSYSLIGAVTIVEVEATLANETDASTTIKELTYELATEFYNAAVFTDGPPDSTYIHPYSEIQVFDVWNQFMWDRRVFQGVLQGLDLSEEDADSEADNAHLVHKWFLEDFSNHTANRIFVLLTFDQNHRDGGWTGTFREVDNFLRPKDYLNRTFKYLTNG